jgi:hypothetical protein
MVLGFSLYAFAQNPNAASPGSSVVGAAAQPVVAVPAPAAVLQSAPVSVGFVGIIIAIVAGLNVLLSSVQQIFSGLSKSEPGWLQSISSIVLAVAKYLGSNPNV